LPTATNNIQSTITDIHSKRKSILFILGSQTNVALLNDAQTLVSLSGGNGSTGDAFPVLAQEFTLFNLPENVKEKLPYWPPLAAPFGEYRVSDGASVLLNQKIGSVTTKYPLILFQQTLMDEPA
jgi:hypothetical protein